MLNTQWTYGHMGLKGTLGLLCVGPDKGAHFQNAADWDRTCIETVDPLHRLQNSHPMVSILTTGHQLENSIVWSMYFL